jgi:hypothetical protein
MSRTIRKTRSERFGLITGYAIVLYGVGAKFVYKFHEITQMLTVPLLSRLVPELSLRRTKCNSRLAHENVGMGTVACFPPNTLAFPCQYHSASVPFSYSSYNTALITRTSRRILGTLKNNSATSHIGEYWTEIYCHKILVNFIILNGFNLSVRFHQCFILTYSMEQSPS